MLPGMDPKNMAKMMKQMGIKSEELEATRVIIEMSGKKLIVENPQVVQITMQGQKSFQISGTVKEDSSSEDIKLIMEQTGASEEKAKAALESAGGDIAEAIVALSEGSEEASEAEGEEKNEEATDP